MEFISTPQASAPGGHYAQAVADHGFLFVSGQLPVAVSGIHAEPQPMAGQARLALANLLAIVAAAGCQREDIIKVTVYVVGVEHWAEFNRVYALAMGSHTPARAIVPVPALHHGYLVEIEAVVRHQASRP